MMATKLFFLRKTQPCRLLLPLLVRHCCFAAAGERHSAGTESFVAVDRPPLPVFGAPDFDLHVVWSDLWCFDVAGRYNIC